MHRLCPMLALAIALGLPAGAGATVVSGSFSGVINGNIYDTYGLFGAPGTNLSGETLTASYSYDTGAAFSYTLQPTYDAYLGTDNLALSVAIGGVTVTTGVVTESQVIDTQDGTLTSVSLSNFAPTPLLEFSLVAQGAWQPGVTINAALALDPRTDGQTIYVSADGSHYDAVRFTALPVPAPGPLLPLGVGLLGLSWARRVLRMRPRIRG
jgi:hypothetical protein